MKIPPKYVIKTFDLYPFNPRSRKWTLRNVDIKLGNRRLKFEHENIKNYHPSSN